MFKILIVVIVLIVLGTIFAALAYFNPQQTTSTPSVSSQETQTTDSKQATATATLLDQVKNINSKSSSSDTNISTEDHIKLLENTVTVLQRRIENLEKASNITSSTNVSASASPSTTTTGFSKASVYIPIGGQGSVTAQSYTNVDGFGVILDPADFEGYKSVSLEANLNVPSIVGTGSVQLYNSTDSKAVIGSEVSTTSGSYVVLSSGGFSLASGKKTYFVQAKSSSGHLVNIQNVRLKVSF